MELPSISWVTSRRAAMQNHPMTGEVMISIGVGPVSLSMGHLLLVLAFVVALIVGRAGRP